jgi:hypothetical protein
LFLVGPGEFVQAGVGIGAQSLDRSQKDVAKFGPREGVGRFAGEAEGFAKGAERGSVFGV